VKQLVISSYVTVAQPKSNLQCLEHKYIIHLANKYSVLFCFRTLLEYVDSVHYRSGSFC